MPGPNFHTLNTPSINNSFHSHLYTFTPYSPNELKTLMSKKSPHFYKRPAGKLTPSCREKLGAVSEDTRQLSRAPAQENVSGASSKVTLLTNSGRSVSAYTCQALSKPFHSYS